VYIYQEKGGVVRTWFEIPCGIPGHFMTNANIVCTWVYLWEWGWNIRTDTTWYCGDTNYMYRLFMADIPVCFLGN